MVRHLPNLRPAKFRTLAIGGALCLAAAGSVAGVTLPSSPGATSAAAPASSTAVTATAVRLTADTLAGVEAARAVAVRAAAAHAAAVRAAAAAKAARVHAEHLAHDEHLAQLAARARAAHLAAAARAAAARAAAQAAAAQAAAQQAAQSAAQQAAAQQSAQQTAQVASVSQPSGSPQQIAQQILASAGMAGQFSCLDSLWARESGWNIYAQNPSSGAYGIPQALPGSKMASAGPNWQTSAATQIKWGLSYIDGSYGSPCAAWAHEQADGWY